MREKTLSDATLIEIDKRHTKTRTALLEYSGRNLDAYEAAALMGLSPMTIKAYARRWGIKFRRKKKPDET